MKSEIFNAYYKISLAKETEEKSKTKKNPRDNAMSPKEIAELYGLKPSSHPDMDYEYNIVEVAHPESLIISPSYDPANGLVGNQNQNHARIKHVVTKDPRGQLDGHISAKANLILSLIKTANHMDAINNDELRVLADTCLNQVSIDKKSIKSIINKKAWVLPALKGISALIGLWQGTNLLQNVLPKSDIGLNSSYSDLVKQLNTVLNSNTNFGVGVEFKDSFKNILSQILLTLDKYKKTYDDHSKLITDIQVSNASDLFNKKTEVEKSKDSIISLKENSLKMKEFIHKVINLLKNDSFINNQVFDKGALTSGVESNITLNFLNTVLNPFNSDVITPLIDSCQSFTASLDSLINDLSKSQETSVKSEQAAEMELGQLPEFQSLENKNTENSKEDFNLKDFFK